MVYKSTRQNFVGHFDGCDDTPVKTLEKTKRVIEGWTFIRGRCKKFKILGNGTNKSTFQSKEHCEANCMKGKGKYE